MTQPQEVWKQKVDLFRRRFSCREDVFAVKWSKEVQKVDPATGETTVEKASGFAPQCENFWAQDLCLIREKRGNCSTCTNQKYARLTDEWIWKHISGKKELVLYLVQDKGIRFGAIDFDLENPFKDALLCRNYSESVLGMPCYIARSSKKGYHLYWFFSDFVAPHIFTSVIRRVLKEVGINERALTNPKYRLPEVFPKQVAYHDNRIGNGIKVPMIETRFEDGYNCWVDNQANPIPVAEQWKFFEEVKEVTPEQLGGVVQAHSIEIIERAVTRSAQANERHATEGKYVRDPNAPKDELRGDFKKVIKHCPALQQFWEQDAQGNYVFDKEVDHTGKGAPHAARLPSMLLALQTKNGEAMLLERWPGEKTQYYIEHAHEHDYSPVTCRYLQETGICKIGKHPKFGDHCLKKQAPRVYLGGMVITNPDELPENQWPEPSPIRFATLREGLSLTEILEQLNTLFAGKKPEELPPDWSDQFYNLLKDAEKLSAEEKKKVDAHIKAHKLMPAKELKELKQQVKKDTSQERIAEKKLESPHFHWKRYDFFMEDNHYVVATSDQKGNKFEEELTNFTIDVTEELVEYQTFDGKNDAERIITDRWFVGYLNVNKQRTRFKLRGAEWQSSSDAFFKALLNLGGGDLQYERKDYDHIRLCVNRFSCTDKVIRKKTNDIGHFTLERRDYYLMPSVIVSADGIKINDEFEISFRDELCRNLDFKIISEQDFKDLGTHIITDFFYCNTPLATMTAFAHAMASAMISHMPLKKSPILWITGNFSGGKSFIGEMAQCFFGDFASVTGMGGSGISKVGMANIFRDSLLYMDDYKQSLDQFNGKEILKFVQTAYDRGGRSALNRDGSLRENMPRVRGNIMISGEEVPTQEASALSRMIIVDIPGEKEMNREKGGRVKEKKHLYCGFTPYFLQFIYCLPQRSIQAIYDEYRTTLEGPIRNRYGGDGMTRIAENLASNMTAFRLAMDMLVSRGAILQEQGTDLCAQHLKNLEIIRTSICGYVNTQKGSAIFLNTVRELLQNPSSYHIYGWGDFNEMEHRNSKRLGFWKHSTPDVIYIIPQETHRAANQQLKESKNYLQSQNHIGRQLYTDGHIPEGMFDTSQGTSYMKQIIGPDGIRTRVWSVKLESLGFTHPTKPEGVQKDLNRNEMPSSVDDREQPPLPMSETG